MLAPGNLGTRNNRPMSIRDDSNHINPRQVELSSPTPARLFFPPGSHEEHVDRAAFELERNLSAALAMNREARVRQFEVDRACLAQASRDMRRVMGAMLTRHRDELAEDGRLG